MLAAQDVGRRTGMAEFVDVLVGDSQLRDSLAPEEAADLAWVLTDPATYHRLVEVRGWEPVAYTAWLGSALYDSLCRRR